jgi:hypothetical protein
MVFEGSDLAGTDQRRSTEGKLITMANEPPTPSSADLLREQRMQRNLKIVVAGLGVLILLGLGAVVAGIVGLASGDPKGKSGPAPAASSSLPATLDLKLPQGEKIVSVSLSGNRLAVYHEGPAGPGITIIDIQTGQHLLDVKATQSVPSND